MREGKAAVLHVGSPADARGNSLTQGKSYFVEGASCDFEHSKGTDFSTLFTVSPFLSTLKETANRVWSS